MTDDEKAIMQKHSVFWDKLLLDGNALVTGPVLDPNGTYGFAVIFAGSEEEARKLLANDPAQALSKYYYYPMLANYVGEK